MGSEVCTVRRGQKTVVAACRPGGGWRMGCRGRDPGDKWQGAKMSLDPRGQ